MIYSIYKNIVQQIKWVNYYYYFLFKEFNDFRE